MDFSKRPDFSHLIIALESAVLLAFLVLLTPWGSRMTVGRDTAGVEENAAGSEGDTAGVEGNAAGPEGDAAGVEENAAGPEEETRAGGADSDADRGRNRETDKKDYIHWVDFQVTSEALNRAFRYDVSTCQSEIHLNWIELLAYLGARYGGDFSRYSERDMDEIAVCLRNGEKLEEITAGMKYYPYYLEAYTAVLGGMVGEYQIEIPGGQAPDFALPKDSSGNPIRTEDNVWVTKYGLKAFSPIAKNYPYTDFDDFGASRSYGFKRRHLGHDMMGQVGTPVIAVESGYVEAMGWNRYGGWRLGIRSFDGRRYYYYAHLRKNYPYHKSLQVGSVVQAGDVIGYLGRTGYSQTENTNNIDEAHLHFGLQLIFDESQKEGDNEIWIDCYQLVKFLYNNRSETVRDAATKEHYRAYQMQDPDIPGGAREQKLPAETGGMREQKLSVETGEYGNRSFG